MEKNRCIRVHVLFRSIVIEENYTHTRPTPLLRIKWNTQAFVTPS